jgi:hypothetical protein
LAAVNGDALLDEVRTEGVNASSSRLLVVLVVDDKPHFIRDILHLVCSTNATAIGTNKCG